MSSRNPSTAQEKLSFFDPDRASPMHDEIVRWLDTNIEDVLMTIYGLQKRPTQVRTKWESVITQRPTMHRSGAGQIIGYADLLVRCDRAPGLPEQDWGGCGFVFEAKTKIESLGELFRQIHKYQTGFAGNIELRHLSFVVVCPDDSNATLLTNQGVEFFKYDPKNAFPIGGV